MKMLHWFATLLSAAPMAINAEVEESRRKRQAASARHAQVQRHNWKTTLDLIDRQEGNTPPAMDAIEALLRGEPKE